MDNRKIVISLFFTVFIDMMGFSIIFPLFPNLLKHFQEIDSTSFSSKILFSLPAYFSILKESPYYLVFIGGLISSLYSILQFLFSPIWGRMSDRLGRKKILLFTTFGSMFGYCIWIFSDNFNFFILSRIITGVMGGNISVASASMADISSEKDRAKFMGLTGAGIGLGFIFGPPIGGIISTLSANTSLQNSFPFLTIFPLTAIIAFLLASINFLILIFYYRETLLVKNSTYAKKIHPVLELKSSSSKELPIFCLLYFLFTFAFSGFEFSFNFYLSYFF